MSNSRVLGANPNYDMNRHLLPSRSCSPAAWRTDSPFPYLARARDNPSKTSSSPSSLQFEHSSRDRSLSLALLREESPLQTELAPPVELAVLATSLSVLAAASRSSCRGRTGANARHTHTITNRAKLHVSLQRAPQFAFRNKLVVFAHARLSPARTRRTLPVPISRQFRRVSARHR